jgi:hypothetical protein
MDRTRNYGVLAYSGNASKKAEAVFASDPFAN